MRVILVSVVFFWVLYPSQSFPSARFTPDFSEIVQGGALTGTLTVTAETEKIWLAGDFELIRNGVSYLVTTPSGEIIEMSQGTQATSICGKFSGIIIEVGESIKFPVVLFKWKGRFLFEELGQYSVELFVYSEESNVIRSVALVTVVETKGSLEKWKPIFNQRNNVYAPFSMGYEKFVERKSRAAVAGEGYPFVVKQLFVYGFGGLAIPRFFRAANTNQRLKKSTETEVEKAIAEGSALSREMGIAEDLWQYIAKRYSAYQVGESFDESGGKWKIR